MDTHKSAQASIRSNIDEQLKYIDIGDLGASKTWLEGWICGATDPMLHPGHGGLKDDAMEYLDEAIERKRSAH